METAIKYCQKNDILKEFLEYYGSEVLNMLITEWNTEDALAVRFEEGIEEGEQKIINLLKSGKSPEEIIKEYGNNV